MLEEYQVAQTLVKWGDLTVVARICTLKRLQIRPQTNTSMKERVPFTEEPMKSQGLWLVLASVLLMCVTPDAGAMRKAAHPFYVSVCQIDHNPETDALEISFRLFMDDLEQALETMGTDLLRLGTEREAEKADLYISRYLARHVEIEISGRRVSAAFLGKEVDSDAIWCYLEVENIPVLETMTMTNTLLLETFEDQVNLVHVNAGGQKKSLLFNGQQVRQTLDF